MENLFKIIVGDTEYNVEEPDVDNKDKWSVEENVSYKPDRSKLVLEAFTSKFPNVKALTAESVYKLASRNRLVAEWLSEFNLDFVEAIKVPRAFAEYITPSSFKKAQINIEAINRANLKAQVSVDKAAKIFKEERERVQALLKREIGEVKTSNIEKVILLPSTDLPISLSFAIESYTRKEDQPNAPIQKAYAREIFLNYQIALLGICKAKEGDRLFDIQNLIDDNMLK